MSEPKQVFLLAGGRTSNREALLALLQTVFQENKLTSPKVAYVGTANGDDEAFFNRTASNLIAAGATAVNHVLISPENADLKQANIILDCADIIFISGGDVEEGMRVLREKKMISILDRLYREGKPFFGLSAGSIMLAEKWVRWSNPDNDESAELFQCLGFAPIICDTHGEEDDWPELKMALELSKENVKGYGIISGTAIKVSPNGKVEALGGKINQFIHDKDKVLKLPDILPKI